MQQTRALSSTLSSPLYAHPLNIRQKLILHALNDFNSGWEMLSAGISLVAFKGLSYLTQLYSNYDKSYTDLSDYYDFQALRQYDVFADITTKLLFQDRLILPAHNRGKKQPGIQEQQEAVKIIRSPYVRTEINDHEAYIRTNKGICHGYCIWLAEQMNRYDDPNQFIEFLKTQNLQDGAPSRAVSYQIGCKYNHEIAEQRIDFIQKLFCNEGELSQKILGDDFINSLSKRENLLIRYILTKKTQDYATPYRDRLSLDELHAALSAQDDFCSLFMKLEDEKDLSKCHFTTDEDWQRVLEFCHLSRALQFFIALQFPNTNPRDFELYCKLNDCLEQLTKPHTNYSLMNQTSSRAKFVYNLLNTNELNLSKREILALRYYLLSAAVLYRLFDSTDLNDIETELLAEDDFLTQVIKQQKGMLSDNFKETDKMKEFSDLTNTLLGFIGSSTNNSILYDNLSKQFFKQFPEQKKFTNTLLHSAMNLIEYEYLTISDMAELEKLPEGIWIISCNNLEEGHSMLYRNFQDVPFLIDPNLGLIPLQKDLDDHKNQIGKLLALYAYNGPQKLDRK